MSVAIFLDIYMDYHRMAGNDRKHVARFFWKGEDSD